MMYFHLQAISIDSLLYLTSNIATIYKYHFIFNSCIDDETCPDELRTMLDVEKIANDV